MTLVSVEIAEHLSRRQKELKRGFSAPLNAERNGGTHILNIYGKRRFMVLYVQDVENTSRLMGITTENIAATLVTSTLVSKAVMLVNNKDFEAERKYQVCLSFAKRLLANGSISQEEFTQIDTILLKKYQPLLSVLLSGNDLIN